MIREYKVKFKDFSDGVYRYNKVWSIPVDKNNRYLMFCDTSYHHIVIFHTIDIADYSQREEARVIKERFITICSNRIRKKSIKVKYIGKWLNITIKKDGE